MPASCVFCGADPEDDKPFPPEHWVSQWISRGSIPKGWKVEIHGYGEDEPRYEDDFDLTVPRVCPDCNHGWMSDIESKIRNLALPLILGQPKTHLSAAEQRRLAVWCWLKVITHEIGRPHDHTRTYPDELYEVFRQMKIPPKLGCAISIGRRHIDPADPMPLFIWSMSQGQKRPLPDGSEVTGYRSVIAIGHLVMDALGIYAPARMEIEDGDTRLTQIWPVREPSIRLSTESFTGMRDNEFF